MTHCRYMEASKDLFGYHQPGSKLVRQEETRQMPGLDDYRTLWRLARRRFATSTDYKAFQRFQGEMLIDFFESKGVSLRGQMMLDVGCGSGGYSQLFFQAGAELVSLDLEVHPALAPQVRRRLVLGDVQSLPLSSEQFDVVFCASLIEHVANPGRLAQELYRVLRTGGWCYVGFPPFYSPAGGHQFKPYHLLGERAAVALAGKRASSYASAGGSWGLYPLSIRQARRYLSQAGFTIHDVSTKFLPISFARVPLLGEVLTWYVQFLISKAGA
jgi:SAM-dependent methyltransferase